MARDGAAGNGSLLLSAAVIAGDAARSLGQCLESLAFCDEVVVVVDAGSRDKTLEIARRYTMHVLEASWHGYVVQKNLALERTEGRWVLAVDADEVVSDALRRSIKRVIASNDLGIVGYTVPRRTRYLGQWIAHSGWYPDRKLRLFRREVGRWEGEELHERIEVNGGHVETMDGDLLHYPYESLSDHLQRIDRYSTLAAEELWRSGVRFRLRHLLLHPPSRFVRSYILRGGVLDGLAGLAIGMLNAFYGFCKYAKLWELSLKGPSK
jgi:glycosyltransferase involved in cell wall biosynthesis